MNSASLKPGYISVPSSAIAVISKERMYEKVANPSQFLPLTFPATRSILWDHRSIGKSCAVQLCQRRYPVIFLKEQTLRIIQRLVQEASSSELVFWLIGSVSTLEPDEGNVNITIATVDNSGKRSKTTKEITAKDLKPGEIFIPCAVSTNGTKPLCSEDDYLNSLQVVQNRCRSCGPIDVAQLLSIRANCSYERVGDNTNVHIDFNAVFPGMAFSVTPVNPLPIVPTALSKNLGSPLSISEVQGEPKSGFLTMDHTRKLVLVFDCDRKIQTLPLVGIWVSGVANVDDPFLWASLLRYTFGTNLKERVCLPPEPFLVVLYSVLCSKPEFYECTTGGGVPRLDYTLAVCHDVIQLNKNALGASESPIEIELLPVTGGGQRMDVFYSALETFRNKVRVEESKNAGRADTAEEIVPRTFPVPVATQTLTAQPSVPEVTILDGHNSGLLPAQHKLPQTAMVSSRMDPAGSLARSDASDCAMTMSLQQSQVQSRKPQRSSKAEDMNTAWPVRAPFTYPGPNPSHPNPAPPSSAVHFQSQPQFAAPIPYAFAQSVYQPFPFQRPVMMSQEGHYMTPLPASFGYPPQQPYRVDPSWAFSGGPLVTNVVTNSFRPSRPQSILRNPIPKPTGNQTNTGSQDWYQQTNSLPNRAPGPLLVRPGLAQRPPNPRPVSCVPSTYAAAIQQPNTAQVVSNKRRSLNEAPQIPSTLRSASNKQESVRSAEQQGRPKSQTVATKPVPFCPSPVDGHFQLDTPGSAHNSGSTDSGLQVNDSSGLLESPMQSVPVFEKKFMQIILQQQAKISELERQLHDVKANQMKQPELAEDTASKSGCPVISKSSSHETCSVAINTTQFWSMEPSDGEGGRQPSNSSRVQKTRSNNSTSRSCSTEATPQGLRNGQARIQKGKSDNSANGSCCSDDTPQGFRDGQGAKGGQSKQSLERIASPREQLQEPASFASVENMRRNSAYCGFDTEMDANDMSFGDIHLSQIQIPNPNEDCFVSTMILDMPDCTFFSPERDNTSHDTERNECPRNCESVSPHEQDLGSPIRPSHGFELNTEDSQSRRLASDDLQRPHREILSKASGCVGKREQWHFQSEPYASALKDSRNLSEKDCRKDTVDEFDSRSQRHRYPGIESSADDQTDFTTYSVDQSCLDQTFFPKINYVSMMLDSCSPEMSMSADALAMKYLSDEQLSELAKLRAATGLGRQKVAPELKGRLDVSMYGVQLSQMSFASQKYLERHGLLGNATSSNEHTPCKRVTERQGSGKEGRDGQEEIGELKVQDFIQNLSKTKPRNSLGGGYSDLGSTANRIGTLSSSARSHSDGESFGERSSTPIHGRTAPGQHPVPKRNGERPFASGQVPQRRETYDGCPTPVAQNPAWVHSHATPARTPAQPVTPPSEPLPSSSKIRQRNVMAVDRTLDYTADVIRDSDEDPSNERRQDVYSPVQQPSADKQRTSHVRVSPTLEKVLDVKMIRELPKLL